MINRLDPLIKYVNQERERRQLLFDTAKDKDKVKEAEIERYFFYNIYFKKT